MNDIKSFDEVINEEWGNKDKFAIDNETIWTHLSSLKDKVKKLEDEVELLKVKVNVDRLTK